MFSIKYYKIKTFLNLARHQHCMYGRMDFETYIKLSDCIQKIKGDYNYSHFITYKLSGTPNYMSITSIYFLQHYSNVTALFEHFA